jgi:hypothetical protein
VRAPIGGRAINHTPPYAPTATEYTARAIPSVTKPSKHGPRHCKSGAPLELNPVTLRRHPAGANDSRRDGEPEDGDQDKDHNCLPHAPSDVQLQSPCPPKGAGATALGIGRGTPVGAGPDTLACGVSNPALLH